MITVRKQIVVCCEYVRFLGFLFVNVFAVDLSVFCFIHHLENRVVSLSMCDYILVVFMSVRGVDGC